MPTMIVDILYSYKWYRDSTRVIILVRAEEHMITTCLHKV